MSRFAALAGGAGITLGDHPDQHRSERLVLAAALRLVVGWSFISGGLIAWRQRPDQRVGSSSS